MHRIAHSQLRSAVSRATSVPSVMVYGPGGLKNYMPKFSFLQDQFTFLKFIGSTDKLEVDDVTALEHNRELTPDVVQTSSEEDTELISRESGELDDSSLEFLSPSNAAVSALFDHVGETPGDINVPEEERMLTARVPTLLDRINSISQELLECM